MGHLVTGETWTPKASIRRAGRAQNILGIGWMEGRIWLGRRMMVDLTVVS